MKYKKWEYWIVACFVLLGLFLRTFNLSISPPGFNADEASLGYSAYSVLKTGKDEWGESFPVVFKSFSDYKPGLYVYLDLPFVAILGLNELAVRLPSITLGTLSIFFIYLLSREIFRNGLTSLSSSFLLSVSPWHIHYSRGAWETNMATFFILVGVYAFIKGVENWRWWFISSVSLTLSMYTYQAPRLIVPALAFLIFIFYFKKIFQKKNLLIGLITLILLLPLGLIVLNQRGLARFEGLSIFNDLGVRLRVSEGRGEHHDPNSLATLAFHNKFIGYSLNFSSHYFDHFNPNFIFIGGDFLERNKVPEMGEVYLFEVVTIMVGVYFLIRNRYLHSKIMWSWLLVAPMAASLTYQTPNALRAENMVIPLTLISGLGLGTVVNKIWRYKKYWRYSLTFFLGIVILFSMVRYLDEYFIHLPQKYALSWEYGFSQVVPFVWGNKERYQRIVFTDRYDQPYILVLFYSQFDPVKYQSSASPTSVDRYGFSTVASFDNFEFHHISREEITNSKNTLFVGTDTEIGSVGHLLKEVKFPDGAVAFKIVEGPKK